MANEADKEQNDGIVDKLLHPDQSQGPNEPLDSGGDKKSGEPSRADAVRRDQEKNVEGGRSGSSSRRRTNPPRK